MSSVRTSIRFHRLKRLQLWVPLLRGDVMTSKQRSQENCDFPDCEQHWTYVAGLLRDLLVECRPYVVKADVGEQGHAHLLLHKIDMAVTNSPPETAAPPRKYGYHPNTGLHLWEPDCLNPPPGAACCTALYMAEDIDAGSDIRALFNKGIGVQKGNRFSFSFETAEEAERAFHFIADLGTLQTSRPPSGVKTGAEP